MNQIEVSQELGEILEIIFEDAKRLNPELSKAVFFETIICDWLKLFRVSKTNFKRDKVVLRNRLKDAIKFAGTNQSRLADDLGISRCYLGQVIKGNSEPSIVVALMLLQALGLPPARIGDIFSLESVE